MTAPPDAAATSVLIERLLGDEGFRVAFRSDPAGACRACGLSDLARAFETREQFDVLNRRESRSGLAFVVAGLLEGLHAAGAGEHARVDAATGDRQSPKVAPPVAASQTGAVPAISPSEFSSGAHDAAAYPGDGAPRPAIAAWMAAEARRHGVPGELPVMAALVESNVQNLPRGDRSSVGYFQMQTTIWLNEYPGYPQRPDVQMKWFIDQALAVRAAHPELASDPSRWGEWVASIERPATSLRWKYGARLDDARALLADASRSGPAAAHEASIRPAVPAVRTGRFGSVPPAPAAAQTGAHAFLSNHAQGPVASAVERLKAEAERIDEAHVRYVLGGGHGANEPYGSPLTPLDCSGAVSRVLGIDPRVSGDLASWGEPGPGKRVTIFANAEHVFMEIDGRFWGTSHSNPGGGPGWIPRTTFTVAYLAQFTKRHPPGM